MTCQLERAGENVRVTIADRGAGLTASVAETHLPALLHDQEVGRHGTGPGDLARHRAPPRRDDRPVRARRRRRRGPRRAAARAGGIALVRVLVVDDEEVIRDILGTLLTREGYDVTAAASAAEAVAALRGGAHRRRPPRPDAARPARPRRAARRPAARPRRRGRHHHRVRVGRERHRGDARGRVPLHHQAVQERRSAGRRPQRAEPRRLVDENRAPARGASERFGFARIVGKSAGCARCSSSSARRRRRARRSSSRARAARARSSSRARSTRTRRAPSAPFVTVNSGTMPADLLESKLFGHVKGAFTGADRQQEGPVRGRRQRHDLLRRDRQRAAGDAGEAAARHPGARVHAPRRHGDHQGRRPHHRRDQRRPAEDGREGRFREDLFYRLHVITISLPPLRERSEDIPLLVEHFLRLYAAENEKPIAGIDARGAPRAARLRLARQRPRARERHRARRRALPRGGQIGVDLLPEPVLQPDRGELPIRLPEKARRSRSSSTTSSGAHRTALARTGGVQKRAAELLQIKPTTLNEMIKRLEIRDN